MIPSYIIKYSYRKTISIRIDRKWNLLVSGPIGVSESKIKSFVESKAQWIIEKIDSIKKQIPDTEIVVTKKMKEIALIQILPRVEYYAHLMQVDKKYTTIKITTANTKWWSCNSRGWLMFHWKLSEFPISIVDYVIVHELAHLIHFNHSKNFRDLVETYYPEYKTAKKRLKDHSQWKSLW